MAFDLGDTLVDYEGLPLNWAAHYPAALSALAAALDLKPTASEIGAACTTLASYNTRLHPREREIPFTDILREILPQLGGPADAAPLRCARAFFGVFRARLRCFSDTRPALAALRQRGYKIGVFTDVPYGMPRELVEEDVSCAGLESLLDVLLTSTDIGRRKPSPLTLQCLAEALPCTPAAMIYVGNEQKDITAARAFGCTAILLDRHDASPDWGQDRTISLLSEL